MERAIGRAKEIGLPPLRLLSLSFLARPRGSPLPMRCSPLSRPRFNYPSLIFRYIPLELVDFALAPLSPEEALTISRLCQTARAKFS